MCLFIMFYNNFFVYWVLILIEILWCLFDVFNLVVIKELVFDLRCIIDMINVCGECYIVFVGLDDVVLEELFLGVEGWVLGLINVFF